jgi:hypothetical protein
VRRWMLYRCDLGTGELGLGGERGGERGGGVLDCFLVNLSSFFFCKRCWTLRHKDTCRHLDWVSILNWSDFKVNASQTSSNIVFRDTPWHHLPDDLRSCFHSPLVPVPHVRAFFCLTYAFDQLLQHFSLFFSLVAWFLSQWWQWVPVFWFICSILVTLKLKSRSHHNRSCSVCNCCATLAIIQCLFIMNR